MKCSVYIAASLDGFIARPNGDIDWLLNPAYDTGDKLGLSYDEFIASVDGLVMGRHSFEIPILLGAGLPLFGTIGLEIHLRHRQTTTTSGGFVQSRYETVFDTD